MGVGPDGPIGTASCLHARRPSPSPRDARLGCEFLLFVSERHRPRMEKNVEVRTMKHKSNKRRLTITVCSSLTY
ncbi:hypothetical protein TNCT_201902 [Trichonephila clavata]|uniref:Uncharacterized protein n=1 Tax=Trichonephila clavata TaxID=2740835 RepID=A0A8X6GUC9_TRICU|nr:hypothetical protein TNCT_201902 [Trichonephila clavata]